jgi:hypothetical protein
MQLVEQHFSILMDLSEASTRKLLTKNQRSIEVPAPEYVLRSALGISWPLIEAASSILFIGMWGLSFAVAIIVDFVPAKVTKTRDWQQYTSFSCGMGLKFFSGFGPREKPCNFRVLELNPTRRNCPVSVQSVIVSIVAFFTFAPGLPLDSVRSLLL